jgi:ABC-2 type transport system ATP-binding protein
MAGSPVVVTSGLTKQFESHLAVNHVDLEIAAGEVYGLIGPNGAGKTTLIRMLAKAEEPTLGSIYICQQQLLHDRPDPAIQKEVGYLPDDFPLYDELTVVDYLDYFGRLYYLRDPFLKQRIQDILELVDLQDKRNSLVGTLSRGMRQRLSLARTIIHNPKLLLLDEPVSGLDPIARIEYRETIKALQAQGMTILISSHILSDLESFCTSIGIMEKGRLVESSRLEHLYQRDYSYQRLLIACLEGPVRLEEVLKTFPQVIHCQRVLNTERVGIQLEGGREMSAQLLRYLMEQGVSITEFSPVKDTLEDVFLKLGYRQTA